MKALRQAIQSFLAPLGLPVWASAQVPAGTRAPYMTWAMQPSGFTDVFDVTAACWYRDDQPGCTQMLQRMRCLLPEGGVVLRFPGGMAVVYRGASALERDASDGRLCGGRMQMELHLYAQDLLDEMNDDENREEETS